MFFIFLVRSFIELIFFGNLDSFCGVRLVFLILPILFLILSFFRLELEAKVEKEVCKNSQCWDDFAASRADFRVDIVSC